MMRFSALALSILFLSPHTTISAAGPCELVVLNARNEKISVTAEIARTPDERALGLMNRQFLPENSGMLFVFEYEQMMSFWMKNTYVPLSIAYIDRHGIIREIYDMKPLDTSVSYPSRREALYALEVNAGWFERNTISRGSRVLINGCLGQ